MWDILWDSKWNTNMSRPIHKLSARTVQTARPGRHGDGGGLYLRVTATGSKRWVFRFTDPQSGAVQEMGLGSAGASGVSLAEARQAASEKRAALRSGANPIAQKRAAQQEAQQITFGEFADEFVDTQAAGFRSAKHIDQWRMTLTVYAEDLRDLPIATIDASHILAVLDPIWRTKPETASRLRGRIERVLDAAKARGLRSGENPARWRGHLALLLPKRLKLTRGHHRALPYAAIPDFMASVRTRSGPAARALEFLILTAARSGEVRLMKWSEVDEDAMIWTVPPERMKAGREHRVPLTKDLLEIAKKASGEETLDLVFPTLRSKTAPSDAALTNVLKRMKVDTTVHGFRSSFRDWAGDLTDFSREVAEAALAHVVGDATERAYRRGDAFEKRRQLMLQWQAFCFSGVA